MKVFCKSKDKVYFVRCERGVTGRQQQVYLVLAYAPCTRAWARNGHAPGDCFNKCELGLDICPYGAALFGCYLIQPLRDHLSATSTSLHAFVRLGGYMLFIPDIKYYTI